MVVVDHSNSSTAKMLLSVDLRQNIDLQANVWLWRWDEVQQGVTCGGSAMATVTNKQVGGDEEDVCEDSRPVYIYVYVCVRPEGCFIK